MTTSQSSKRNIITALMVATFLTAIDTTVVSTAMPAIAGDLGQSELISWVFSIYLLTTGITTPIYGKLADLFGRKKIFLFGTATFLIGSGLCGMSTSMTQLMIFRALQGIGAGAVQPMTMTIIGDVFSQEERAKLMGLFSSMWGVAGIVGPLVGGFFVDYISWEWIFYINLPVGLVAIFLIWKNFHENVVVKKVHIDYYGALFFSLSLGLFLYSLLSGGEGSALNLTAATWMYFIVSAVLFGIFLMIERRVPEPLVPLRLYKMRLMSVSQAVSFVQGGILMGINAYLPMWIISVMGHSATYAGLSLLPMSIGWPIAASLGGRMLVRSGYKRATMIGLLLLILGYSLLSLVNQQSPVWMIPLVMFIIGAGFGYSMTAITISVQSSVGWQQRGVATGTLQFTRIVGQTVGVAVLGAVFNTYSGAGVQMAVGLETVFQWMVVMSIIAALIALLLPAKAEQAEPDAQPHSS
ncbi:MDR family MFS transporter [Brevibacillus dissolubilis]|uniref:MDR family MFS transporter n=1 Tax=Brevibacillus dissolubilis TaxID=1844116 RepID=UPI00111696E3|nr:MDR family MFS transporter [Brevibacillus dissolubilis]